MSADDYTNSPLGTYVLEDRMSLIHFPIHTQSRLPYNLIWVEVSDLERNPT